MYDVIAHPHMHGCRDAQPVRGGKHTDVLAGEVPLVDIFANGLAKPRLRVTGIGATDDIVEGAGLAPEPELPGAYIAGDALRSGPYGGQFKVMDYHCSVTRYNADIAALHHVNDMPLHPGAQYMGTHHQNDRGTALPCAYHPSCRVPEPFRRKRSAAAQVEHHIRGKVVDPVGQGLQFQPTAIESLVSSHGICQKTLI